MQRGPLTRRDRGPRLGGRTLASGHPDRLCCMRLE